MSHRRTKHLNLTDEEKQQKTRAAEKMYSRWPKMSFDALPDGGPRALMHGGQGRVLDDQLKARKKQRHETRLRLRAEGQGVVQTFAETNVDRRRTWTRA